MQQHSISSVRAICSAIILSAGMQLYCFTVLILEEAGKLINWKAIGFQPKLYFFLAHCALQGNLCGILLKGKRKMQLCSELGQMQYYSKSRVTSCSVSWSFLLSAHIDHEHTSSCVYISCPPLPLPGRTFLSLQGACTFTVATEILQRQTQATLETRMMTTCWTEKNTSCRGAENHVSGANSQIRHPRHFLLDVPPMAMPSSVYAQGSPVTFTNGKKHGRQRPQTARERGMWRGGKPCSKKQSCSVNGVGMYVSCL